MRTSEGSGGATWISSKVSGLLGSYATAALQVMTSSAVEAREAERFAMSNVLKNKEWRREVSI